MGEIMNADEVSVYLNICKKTVYHLAKQGLLPASKVGKGFRFYRSEIDKALKRSVQNTSHILVIEPVLGVCKLVKNALEKDGYLVSTANSGEQALECIGDIKFDHIFLDLLMPRGDGLETLKNIRVADKTVPVTIITESGANELVTNSLDYGISTILQKPFEIQDLLNVINKHAIDRRTIPLSVQRESELAMSNGFTRVIA